MTPTSPKDKPNETDQSSIKKEDDRPANISQDKAKQLAEQMNQKAEELFSFIDAQLQNVVWLQLGEAPNDDFSFSSMEGDREEEEDNNDDASPKAEGSNTAASSSVEESNNEGGGNKDASSDEEDKKEDASSGEGDNDDATFSDEENSDDAWFGDLRK